MMKARILVLCIGALATVGALAAVVITGLDTLEEPEDILVSVESAATVRDGSRRGLTFLHRKFYLPNAYA